MNEQRVREIVQEEMKKGTTTVTIAPTIIFNQDAPIDTVIRKIEEVLAGAISRAKGE